MSVPLDQNDPRGADSQIPITSNWTINVSDIRTVKVSNISLRVSEWDIREFFSFSGEIEFVEMQSETEKSQFAYVTFKDSQGAETAMLLSGAIINELSVTITPVENYQLPPGAVTSNSERSTSDPNSAIRKAEDAVSSMLAKGFILGKDALNKAKSFDERHHLMSNASAAVASLDGKMGLREKISLGTSVVNQKVKEVDEKYQVSEITKSALAAAEQKASSASAAIMNNQYVSTGAAWVSNAFSLVAKAAEDVSLMTKEKVIKAEEEKKENIYKERTAVINNYAKIHLDESFPDEPAVLPVESADDGKLGII
ncbi:hypothetical protein Syun_022597 [Stephania yunnanensis]|uniref:RRM domain-containing protein n=1 Tax=Stephania yunnanensis TaxID=152371 RepID=A0AAP0F889_9MAGN